MQLSLVPQPPASASASRDPRKRKQADSEVDASEADSEAAALRKQRHTLIRALRECARTRDASGALAIFGQMEAASMTLESADCSLLLHLFSEAEPAPLYAESVRLFDAARAAGVELGEPSWSGMVRLHCVSGQIGRAEEALAQMRAAGVEPRLRSFSPLLAAAGKTGDRRLAASACRRMRAAGLSPAVPDFVALGRMHLMQARSRGMRARFDGADVRRMMTLSLARRATAQA